MDNKYIFVSNKDSECQYRLVKWTETYTREYIRSEEHTGILDTKTGNLIVEFGNGTVEYMGNRNDLVVSSDKFCGYLSPVYDLKTGKIIEGIELKPQQFINECIYSKDKNKCLFKVKRYKGNRSTEKFGIGDRQYLESNSCVDGYYELDLETKKFEYKDSNFLDSQENCNVYGCFDYLKKLDLGIVKLEEQPNNE